MNERKVASPQLERAARLGLETFRELLHVAAGATLVGCAVGCTSEQGADATRETVECDVGAIPSVGGPLRTTAPVDHIEIEKQQLRVEGSPLDAPAVYPAARFGLPCESSAEPFCGGAEHRAALTSPGCGAEPCPQFAVVRSGTSYRRITDRDELLGLLGSIDSTSEAVLLAALDGHPVRCDRNADAPGSASGTYILRDVNGYILETTWENCGVGVFYERAAVTQGGGYRELEKTRVRDSNCTIGRRPEGLCALPHPRAASQLGVFFAQAAQLEAASVYAFRQLGRELFALGAPCSLVDDTLAALADELKHTRQVTELARAFGAAVDLPEVARRPDRSLLELALDNAQEGCVRETFGALIATYQAATAEHEGVRRVMREIAEDETRHAHLSWRLAAWLEPQLEPGERARVEGARAGALARLAEELESGLSDEQCRAIGWPRSEVAASLLRALAPAMRAQVEQRTTRC